MYDVKKDGRVFCSTTGLLVSTFVNNLLLEVHASEVGTIFEVNYLYESRVTGFSISELKKLYAAKRYNTQDIQQ